MRLLSLVSLGLLLPGRVSPGQEIRGERTPLSAWIDLRPTATGASPQNVPAWIEAVEFLPAVARTGASAGSATARYRIRLNKPSVVVYDGRATDTDGFFARLGAQPLASTPDDLQLRVLFDDSAAGARVRVSTWDELGTQLMRSQPLGQALGLPSSQTLTVAMKGVDYLEIDAGADGSQVRAVFLTWLEKSQVRESIDFPAGDAVREPFRILSATRAKQADSYLYGVVTASLQTAPLLLPPATSGPTVFEFNLEKRPLLAVLTYEALGATVGAAPAVAVNAHSLGASELALPDLADPAFQGQAREADPQMSFRYTGWLRTQKVIPGDLLTAGPNQLSIEVPNGSDTVAVRNVEIQLKYNWEKLDYILPAPTREKP